MTDTPSPAAAEILSRGRKRDLGLILTAVFLTYANIALFFGFHGYLQTLPIDPGHYGLLMGAFSAISLLLRPLVSPFVHQGNAKASVLVGELLLFLSLLAYRYAEGFLPLLLVRLFHGAAFVFLGTALLTLLLPFIPESRSARVFGYLAVLTILPGTLLPPLLPALDRICHGFPNVLALFAGIGLMAVPLLYGVGKEKGQAGGRQEKTVRRSTRKEVLGVLGSAGILLILGAMLLLYTGYGILFYFLDGYGRMLGIVHTGAFLTLTTLMEIGGRLVLGTWFDRYDKALSGALVLAFLSGGYLLLAQARGDGLFYASALCLGLGWGIAMPVLNGLLFDVAKGTGQAFAVNLGVQMFQAGLLLGPLLGGAALGLLGLEVLFDLCAVVSLLGSALLGLFVWRKRRHERHPPESDMEGRQVSA